jgi:hypothetical protein
LALGDLHERERDAAIGELVGDRVRVADRPGETILYWTRSTPSLRAATAA